jgi:hypothetical protein
LALDEIAAIFGRLGYRGVLLAEHDRGFTEERWKQYGRACEAASTDRTTLVPGIEYSDADNDIHVLVWGCESFLGEARETAPLLADVQARGGVSVLAHPGRRNAAARLDDASIRLLNGVEIWNRKYDGVAPGVSGLDLHASARHLSAFVGLDFHTRRQMFPLTMLLEASESSGVEGLLSALRTRRCAPQALGAPMSTFLTPTGLSTLRAAERARRVTRDRLRAVHT